MCIGSIMLSLVGPYFGSLMVQLCTALSAKMSWGLADRCLVYYHYIQQDLAHTTLAWSLVPYRNASTSLARRTHSGAPCFTPP